MKSRDGDDRVDRGRATYRTNINLAAAGAVRRLVLFNGMASTGRKNDTAYSPPAMSTPATFVHVSRLTRMGTPSGGRTTQLTHGGRR
jgi:hypothetical protein